MLGLLRPRRRSQHARANAALPPIPGLFSLVALSNRTVVLEGGRITPSVAVQFCAVRARWRKQLALGDQPRSQLRQAQADRQAADAKATGKCKYLHEALLACIEWRLCPGKYLWRDCREAASVRARPGLNRCNLRVSQFSRGMRDSPDCVACAGVPESLDHILICQRGPWSAAPYAAESAIQLLGYVP